MLPLTRRQIKRVPFAGALFRALVREKLHIKYAWRELRSPLSTNPPFNGQEYRRRCIDAIIAAVQPHEIIETGTFRGSTTRYFAEHYECPVYTIDNNRYLYLYSKLRLLRHPRAHAWFGDSRKLLRQRKAAGANAIPTFFYLDAHWRADLPLRDEVNFIIRHWAEAVICIDDFRVDDDPGYSYARYRVFFTLDYIALPSDVAVYFPAAPSSSETGLKKSGAVFLALGKTMQENISTCVPHHLRPVESMV